MSGIAWLSRPYKAVIKVLSSHSLIRQLGLLFQEHIVVAESIFLWSYDRGPCFGRKLSYQKKPIFLSLQENGSFIGSSAGGVVVVS